VDRPIGDVLREYQAAVDDYDRELARALDVNETDLRCLEILLIELPEASPSQLAERLGLTTGSITSLLDRLARVGYLTREPHPTDRRKTVVRATACLRQRADALTRPLVDEGQTMVDSYAPAQVEIITDFLARATTLQRRHIDRIRRTEAS